MRGLLIINPEASYYTDRRFDEVKRHLEETNIDFDYVYTEYKGHARELARNSDGCELVGAVSGDGTANDVVNEIVGLDKTFFMVPFGFANDSAKSLNFSRDVEKVCDRLYKGKTIEIDVGRVMASSQTDKIDRYFISSLGIGFVGELVKNLERVPDWIVSFSKIPQYLYSALKLTPKESKEMVIEYDGKVIEGDKLTAIVLNTPLIGGLELAYKAKMDDGSLDLIVVGNLSLPELYANILMVYPGWYLGYPRRLYKQAKEIHIHTEPAYVQIDGDLLSEKPFQDIYVTACPRKLKVI
jgi:diacylglycerol kinase (ATP)